MTTSGLENVIILPGKCVLLNTPKTGSRSIVAACKQIPGAVLSVQHHQPLDMIPKLDLPFYTMIRNPYDMALSLWWEFAGSNLQFGNYIRNLRGSKLTSHETLYPYAKIVDKFFRFEDGLEAMFEQLGYDIEVPKIGVSKKVPIDFDVETLVNQKWPEDVLLWSEFEAARRK